VVDPLMGFVIRKERPGRIPFTLYQADVLVE
jgi:hypothetical protein